MRKVIQDSFAENDNLIEKKYLLVFLVKKLHKTMLKSYIIPDDHTEKNTQLVAAQFNLEQ